MTLPPEPPAPRRCALPISRRGGLAGRQDLIPLLDLREAGDVTSVAPAEGGREVALPQSPDGGERR